MPYRGGRKFQQVLKEILSLFSVVDLEADWRFILEKNVVWRDVFGQLPTGYIKRFWIQMLKLMNSLLLRWLFVASYLNCWRPAEVPQVTGNYTAGYISQTYVINK